MSWKQIDEQRQAKPFRHRVPRADTPERYDELCHMLFTIGAGRELLEMMYDRTVYRRAGPGSSDQELRFLSAQAAFVQEIEAARTRGEQAAAQKASTAA